MKTGVKFLISTMTLMCLTACGGEEEIVYEESPIPLVTEYVLGEDDTAPAFYADIFSYIENNVLQEEEAEETEEGAEPVELSKEEKKLAEEEAKKLEAANEILQLELTRENNRLGSIQLVSMQDTAELNAEAIAEATLAFEELYGTTETEEEKEAEESEGESEEPLSGEEEGDTTLTTTVVTEPTMDLATYLENEVVLAPLVYTYDVSTTGYTGGQATSGYVSYLGSSGYKIIDPYHNVNNEYYEMLTPDFTQRAGTVAMAKKASGTERLMLLVVDWHYYGATVTVSYLDGTLWVAPPPETTASKGSLTISDAVDFLKTRNPSELGLSGNTMDDYSIYTAEGLVIINGVTYREFTILGKTEGGAGSSFGGNYLIDAEGNSYSVNENTGTILPLNITNVFDTM